MITYNQEVGKGRGDAAEGTPKEEDLSTEVRVVTVGTDQVRGNHSNDLLNSISEIIQAYREFDLRSSRTNWTR